MKKFLAVLMMAALVAGFAFAADPTMNGATITLGYTEPDVVGTLSVKYGSTTSSSENQAISDDVNAAFIVGQEATVEVIADGFNLASGGNYKLNITSAKGWTLGGESVSGWTFTPVKNATITVDPGITDNTTVLTQTVTWSVNGDTTADLAAGAYQLVMVVTISAS